MPIDCTGVDKQLRRAEFFRDYLRYQSIEISKDMCRSGGRDRDYQFALENFFSASLNAAQSAFYLLRQRCGPTFKQIYSEWRNSTLDQSNRARLNKLMSLRGGHRIEATTACTEFIGQLRLLVGKRSRESTYELR